MGTHPDSNKFYEHKFNLNLKASGFIDFFLMSETGFYSFRNFFRASALIKSPSKF